MNVILDLLFPPKCVFCGRLLKKWEHDFCADCYYDLPETDTIRKIPRTEGCIAPLRYEGNARNAILRFKFNGHSYYAPAFGRLMAARLSGCKADLITWIPVSRRRKLERGYDQAELLARAVSKQLSLPCVRLLRKRHTKKQSQTGDLAARNANISGAFTALRPKTLAGKHILLIDDICTTGATLREAAETLQLSGAAQISCAVLAITE